MAQVFISYARNDKDFVLKLAGDLRRQGIDLWLDQLDIPPGGRWDDQVEAALKTCGSLLVVLSPESVKSQNVKDEIGAALDQGKPIIPVLIQACDIPMRIKRLQYIDFRGDYGEALAQLVQVLSTPTAWAWDAYGNELTDAAWQQWGQAKWQQAADAYRQALRRDYAEIRILGKSKPVPLAGIFTDVYLLDEVTARKRFRLETLQEEFAANRFDRYYHRPERQNGLELVKQPENDRLFILGKPGAGKTTFLRYLTLQAVEGELDRLPIFINLKQWSTSGLELMAYIAQEFKICQFPEATPFIEYILQQGQALVLFDGLDEVNQEGGVRARIIEQIENFSREYHAAQILVTCRLAANEHAFRHFQDVELADFNKQQIDAFVAKWFGQDEEKLEAFRAEFYHAGNESIRELAAIPILLTLLCLAFEDTMTLANQRTELYKDAIDALLRKWDTHRSIKRDDIYKNLTTERKQRMFARIAAGTFEAGIYFLPQRNLEKGIVSYLRNLPDAGGEIDGRAILKAIEAQHGLFVERARGIYSFSHLTFQEYFTAKYIADNEARGTVKRLIDSHLTDRRWREVFLLTASQLDQADAFFDRFRQAIDELITGQVTLIRLMKRVVRKAAQLGPLPRSPAAVRVVYYYLTRVLDRTRAFDLTRALDYALYRARARDLAHALDLILIPDLGPGLTLDFNLTYAIQIGLIFHTGYHVTEIRQQAGKFARYWAKVVNLSHPFPVLQTALAGLRIPTEIAYRSEWQMFIDGLQKIMRTHRDLGQKWDLTKEQVRQMDRYFEANLLLLECLKLAYVSDRQAIEDSLLLPPGEGA